MRDNKTDQQPANRQLKYQQLKFSVGGAILLFLVEILITLVSADLDAIVQGLLASIFVGAILGTIYEIARQQREMLGEQVEMLGEQREMLGEAWKWHEKLLKRLNYQDRALDMLLSSGHHSELVSKLIEASIDIKFTKIPFVDPNEYLTHLRHAIRHSSFYQGVQRKPTRWFEKQDAGDYLQTLKDQKMERKVRIFLIDNEDIQQMEENLRDDELMQWYWAHTGEDVESFWISEKVFKARFGDLGEPPEDFALYDEMLLIRYDEPRQVLSFDLVETRGNVSRTLFNEDPELKRKIAIFAKLEEQLRGNGKTPFIQIKPLIQPSVAKN